MSTKAHVYEVIDLDNNNQVISKWKTKGAATRVALSYIKRDRANLAVRSPNGRIVVPMGPLTGKPDAATQDGTILEHKTAARAKNRIRIFQWRELGDDEDCLEIRTFPADVPDDMIAALRSEHDIPAPDNPDADDEGTIIVNYDGTIEDGDVLEAADGRRFRISITEVK